MEKKRKILVTNKAKFPMLAESLMKSHENWAFMSIDNTDTCDHYLQSSEHVLNLDFDDINEQSGNATPISYEQGKQAYEFAKAHLEWNLLIHCAAGQSRSQGVARALLDLFPDAWEQDKSNPCLTPNIAVVAAIKRPYYEEAYGSFE